MVRLPGVVACPKRINSRSNITLLYLGKSKGYSKSEKNKLEFYWGGNVRINPKMDKLRKKECLCVNCDRKNEQEPYASCPVAKKIYNICEVYDMAMAITRCGAVDEKGELMYRPI